jgi:hypothetical protein
MIASFIVLGLRKNYVYMNQVTAKFDTLEAIRIASRAGLRGS